MKKESLEILIQLVLQEIENYSKDRTKQSTKLIMIPKLNGIKEELENELSNN